MSQCNPAMPPAPSFFSPSSGGLSGWSVNTNSVCPRFAKNLLGWFSLNTYLQRKLGTGIHFEPQDNFLIERKAVLEQEHHVVVYATRTAPCVLPATGLVPKWPGW